MIDNNITLNKDPYPELYQFHQQIQNSKESSFFRPYSAAVSRTMVYKLIFCLFAGLFIFLGWFVYMKSFSWTINFIFGEKIRIRGILIFICAALAASSGSIGLMFRTELDVKAQIMKEAAYRLKRLFNRHLVHHGIHRTVLFGPMHHKYCKLHHTYQEALDEMRKHRIAAKILLERIANSNTIDSMTREELFNQALLQLKDNLLEVLKNYRDS